MNRREFLKYSALSAGGLYVAKNLIDPIPAHGLPGAIQAVIGASSGAAPAAFPSGALIDAFTGTDGTALATHDANWGSWSSYNTLEIQNNGYTTSVTNGSESANVWNGGNYGPDVDIWVTLNTRDSSGTTDNKLSVRTGGTGYGSATGYYLRIQTQSGETENDVWEIWKWLTDAPPYAIKLADVGTKEIQAGDSVGMRVTGSSTVTLQAYHKPAAGSWATFGSAASDSSSPWTSAGKILLTSQSGVTVTIRWDDLYAGTL